MKNSGIEYGHVQLYIILKILLDSTATRQRPPGSFAYLSWLRKELDEDGIPWSVLGD